MIVGVVVCTEQDRGLEALSHVITRQKTLAQAIGTEVDYQNELIEDITDHVDRTRDRIHGETQRVRTIDRKDNTCGKCLNTTLLKPFINHVRFLRIIFSTWFTGYWTVILTLLVIIIIIVAL